MNDIWSSILQWIGSIPPVIWSGAIGAMVALIGVFFADRSNTKRLKLQLEHDAMQEEKDRLAALRKDVYLQAPKEAIKALAYLGALANRDLTTIGDDEGISGYGAVAAQIGVISEISTATAVSRFGNMLAMELATSLVALNEVQDTRVDIKLSEERLEFVFAEVNRMQAERQAMSEAGVREPERERGLDYWIEVRVQESRKLQSKLNALRAKHQTSIFEYNQGFFDRISELSKNSIQVMREVRKEIGLAHELDLFEAEMEKLASELRSSVLEMMQNFAEEMRKQVEQEQGQAQFPQ